MDLERELYLTDSYLKEFRAKVVAKEGEWVELDRTAFYPGGGGLLNDTGVLVKGSTEFRVEEVKREGGRILHRVANADSLNVGDEVMGRIDWERRYAMMKLHTASHVMAAIAYRDYGAKITGGQITPEYAKDDFDLESKDVLPIIVQKTNEVLAKALPVKVYFLKREEALKIEGIVKLAERMPPDIDVWRIVEIEGIDVQADGGPHVRNTAEVGKIKLLKVESKGKNRKRVYYALDH